MSKFTDVLFMLLVSGFCFFFPSFYYCFSSFFLNLLLLALSWSLISGSNQPSFGSPALQFPPSFFSYFCVSRLVPDWSATLHPQALYQPTGTISPSIVPCRLMHGSSLAFSSQEDLNMKINFLQHPSIFLAIYGKHVYIDIWRFFLDFFRILGIENLEKHLILAFSIFNITFWLHISRKKRAAFRESSEETLLFREFPWLSYWGDRLLSQEQVSSGR